jgi:hypothetical protein
LLHSLKLHALAMPLLDLTPCNPLSQLVMASWHALLGQAARAMVQPVLEGDGCAAACLVAVLAEVCGVCDALASVPYADAWVVLEPEAPAGKEVRYTTHTHSMFCFAFRNFVMFPSIRHSYCMHSLMVCS